MPRNPLRERISVHAERLNDRWFDRGGFLRYYKLLVAEALRPGSTVLHLGSGRGAIDETWGIFRDDPRGHGLVIALDLDRDELRRNPMSGRLHADATTLPLRDETVDVIVCEYVFEHLERPDAVLEECRRVLRPNGVLVFTTPNRWSYVSVIARVTPMWFHYLVSRLRGTPAEVMYPTHYRLNTEAAIIRAAGRHGFAVRGLRTFTGEPNYTIFLPGVHLLFVALHLLLERYAWLAPWRLNLVGILARHGG